VRVCLIAESASRPVGVLTFSEAPTQTSKRYGGLTLELSRLYLHDEAPKNSESRFVGFGLRYVRKTMPNVRFIVSYADPSVGHSGVIYQATNFKRDGMTDDDRKSPRCDYEAEGRRYSRRSHVPDGAVVRRIPRVSKHRYVYSL
jgi:hypothetical protein